MLLGCANLGGAAEALTMRWTVAGVERQALVFPPSAATAGAKAPVVFAFHGHGGTMQGTARNMRFQEVWPEALVVYMQGLPTPSPRDPSGRLPGWQREPGQLGDRDLKFFDAVLATLHTKYSVDDDRVYSAGFSNGSAFSLLLWAERAKQLAAIGVCAGVLPPTVHLTVARPLIHIAGRNDHTAEFDKQLETMSAERAANSCSSPPQACDGDCKLYCGDGSDPTMAVFHPGGHVFPPWASERIVKFFKPLALHHSS
jgi:polyhydroxybutyrate depolymerase